MHLIEKNINFLMLTAIIIVALIPLDYYSFFGIRVILFKTFFVALISIVFFAISLTEKTLVYFLLLLYAFLISMWGGQYTYLVSMAIFSILSAWPLLVRRGAIKAIDLSVIVNTYALISVVVAIFVVIQWGMYTVFGLHFLNIAFYGSSRVAVGFIWSDFSFLSLYLSSATFIVVFSAMSRRKKQLFFVLLFLASILTSARTGPVALIISVMIGIYFRVVQDFRRGVVNRRLLFICLFGVAGLSLTIPLWGRLTGRPLTLSSTGRDSGNYYAFIEFFSNPLFGVAFNVDSFVSRYAGFVDARPHNVFLEFALLGGVGFLILGIIYMSLVLREAVIVGRPDLIFSVLCAFIGFLFIPSFFSAYFLAVLISFIFLARRQGMV